MDPAITTIIARRALSDREFFQAVMSSTNQASPSTGTSGPPPTAPRAQHTPSSGMAGKARKYRNHTEPELESAFFQARAKTLRAGVSQEIAEVIEAPFTSTRPRQVSKRAPIKPASQFHRERKEKNDKKWDSIVDEYGYRSQDPPDVREDFTEKSTRFVRDVALGIKETPKGGFFSQASKFVKNF